MDHQIVTPSPEGDAATPLETEHARTLAALRERIKELDCLYEITRLAQRQDLVLDDILAGVCDIVARAWQYPEIAWARTTLGGRVHSTKNVCQPVSRQSSAVKAHGEIVGRIEVGYLEKCPKCDEGPFLREERHLLDAVADHLGRIIEARNNEERLRVLSHELIKTQENERQRIARELHDDVAQELSMARMGLDRLPGLLTVSGLCDTEGVLAGVRECSSRLGSAITSLRDLAYDLLPPALDQLGLAEAAFRLCEELSARHGVEVDFSADGIEALRLDFETSINLFRVLQEALANACRHAKCSHIMVRLVASHPTLILRIRDDGRGFDVQSRLPQALAEKRMGLWSMRERIRLLGGRVTIRSRPGHGVLIKAEVPVGEETP